MIVQLNRGVYLAGIGDALFMFALTIDWLIDVRGKGDISMVGLGINI